MEALLKAWKCSTVIGPRARGVRRGRVRVEEGEGGVRSWDHLLCRVPTRPAQWAHKKLSKPYGAGLLLCSQVVHHQQEARQGR